MSCKFYEWTEEVKKKDKNRVNKDYVILYEYEKSSNIPFEIYKSIKENTEEKIAENCFTLSGVDKEGKALYKPQDKVGVFPFKCTCGKVHMIIVLPKFARDGKNERDAFESLDQVSEMAIYAIKYDKSQKWYKIIEEAPHSWNGEIKGGHKIILFLILSYLSSLEELVKKDFRRYYITVEEVLKGKVKGRLKISSYLYKWCVGKRMDIPCKWNLFTYDNWDNRILKSALRFAQRRIKSGGLLYKEITNILTGQKGMIKSHFYEVSDYEPWELEFHEARLKSVSKFYRNSLNIAELILKNAKSPSNFFQNLKPTYVDMDKLFEMFVSAIAKEAFESEGYNIGLQDENKKGLFKDKKEEYKTFIFNIGEKEKGYSPFTKPDIVVYKGKDTKFVIDAKYKEILEKFDNPEKEITEEVSEEKTETTEKLKLFTSDMYQLFFYMRSRDCKRGIIVYPFRDSSKSEVYPDNIEELFKNANNKEMTITFLGLNLAKNIKEVFEKAKELLRKL